VSDTVKVVGSVQLNVFVCPRSDDKGPVFGTCEIPLKWVFSVVNAFVVAEYDGFPREFVVRLIVNVLPTGGNCAGVSAWERTRKLLNVIPF